MAAPPTTLLDLPHEVLHNVMAHGEPHDLGRWASTCHALHAFVSNNTSLFREVYLRHFDDPRILIPALDPDWPRVLPNVVLLQKLLLSKKIVPKVIQIPTVPSRDNFIFKTKTLEQTQHLTFIGETIVSLLKTAVTQGYDPKAPPSRNISFLTEMFSYKLNVDTVLCCSSLFERAGDADMHVPANTEVERQLSAKLHTLFGIPVSSADLDDETSTLPYARARVYDLRRYTDGTMWGPFVDDGSQNVDWEKMEAIVTDLSYNLKVFHDRTEGLLPRMWVTPWWGASPYSFVASQQSTSEMEFPLPSPEQDPYGITGTWMRVVCFLDYAELFAFNFAVAPPPIEEHREPIDTEEATRLIGMRFQVVKLEPPGEGDGPGPVAHFTGKSRTLHSAWDRNANSDIKGTVRLTPEGEVRWTTFSVYNGEERWRSEGIQIGGIKAARGVWGTWFDKDYDQHGPAGPTAFWKVSDETADEMPGLFQL